MPETTTAPAWLNAGALEIPEAAVTDLRRTIDELRALVPEMERLTTRARTSLNAIDEADDARKARMGYLPDDVRDALSELTGESELHDVLNVIGWYAGNITESVLTDQRVREEIRERRRI